MNDMYAQPQESYAEPAAPPAPAYVAPPPAAPPPMDYAAELTKLAALKDQGILSEAEFEAKKKQILGI
jgi:hypothetical protein